jgi:hypothetical protein
MQPASIECRPTSRNHEGDIKASCMSRRDTKRSWVRGLWPGVAGKVLDGGIATARRIRPAVPRQRSEWGWQSGR